MEVDEFHGQGGSYIVGKDGKRQIVHRTKDPEPQVQTSGSSEAPAPAAAEAAPNPAKKKGG